MGYILRLVLLIILAWLAYRLVKRILADDSPPAPDDNQPRIEIVPCARCGVHVPREQAIIHDGKAYCSKAHQEEDKE
jgi:uncharacterized protein